MPKEKYTYPFITSKKDEERRKKATQKRDKYSYPFITSKEDEKRIKKDYTETQSFSYPFISTGQHKAFKEIDDDLPIPSSTIEREILSLLKTAIALSFDELQKELSVTATELQKYLHNLGDYITQDKEARYRLSSQGLYVEMKIALEKESLAEL